MDDLCHHILDVYYVIFCTCCIYSCLQLHWIINQIHIQNVMKQIIHIWMRLCSLNKHPKCDDINHPHAFADKLWLWELTNWIRQPEKQYIWWLLHKQWATEVTPVAYWCFLSLSHSHIPSQSWQFVLLFSLSKCGWFMSSHFGCLLLCYILYYILH